MTATAHQTATVSRDEARDFYLRVFDEFAVVIYDPGNKGDVPEDNRQMQSVVDAINAHLDGSDDANGEAGQTIVRDWVNSDYEVWQCFQTYDSWTREQAEAAFDAAWPTTEVEAEAPKLRAVPTASRFCLCGCGDQVKSAKSIFAMGHDARFAGHLIRRFRAGEIKADAAVAEAAKVSGALATKVQRGVERMATNRQARKAAGVRSYREGIVKVGRWDYPARQYESGRVDRNTKRDGSGEWIEADERVGATFRKV